jgi:hypothetical protein
VLRLPVAVQFPLAGSYSSALTRLSKLLSNPAATSQHSELFIRSSVLAVSLCRGAGHFQDNFPGLAKESAFGFASEFFQQFDLDLLNLEQAVVLAAQQMVDFFVQMPDLKFGFQIHFVIVLRS